jgi:hypothetical protein
MLEISYVLGSKLPFKRKVITETPWANLFATICFIYR